MRFRTLGSAILIAGAVLATAPVHSPQGSNPGSWPWTSGCVDGEAVPTFGACGHVGLASSESIRALVVHDDGSGPALWAGGSFTTAGGVPARALARWSGSCWIPFDFGQGGAIPGTVEALLEHDDGAGPALFAAGSFAFAGGVAASRIARWDGAAFAPLGAGTNGTVRALAVFDDGSGAKLFAAGDFTSAGGQAASRIARWNGAAWTPLGGGLDGTVRALAVFDDGSGAKLFAAGEFTSAGGQAASRIARWDGAAWAPLGAGLDGTVRALAVHDDGSGAALYAGGDFASAGGATAGRLARWNGAAWMQVGGGTGGSINALAEYDDGNGARLFVARTPTSGFVHVLVWDGATLGPLGGGNGQSGGDVLAFCVHDDGDGPELVAGGSFASLGGASSTPDVARLARFDGTSWSVLPGPGLDGTVFALAMHDDGSGPGLFIGGTLRSADDLLVTGVVKWDGSGWVPRMGLPAGTSVRALAVHDDGSGPALYTGRYRWNGSIWSLVGSNPPLGTVEALLAHDDGSGLALYAGGDSSGSGRIARWDGASWSTVGGGMGNGSVLALAEYDDGGGPALYAGGSFTLAGGIAATGIARWDGASWAPLAGGQPNSSVHALLVHDDGSGPALYAGGQFTLAGGVLANGIARWNGSAWSALGLGTDGMVHALAEFDLGSGPALVVGGAFTSVGFGGTAPNLAWWNGSTWRAVSGGTSGAVLTLLASGSGAKAALHVGGAFLAHAARDANIALWRPCQDTKPPVLSCPHSVTALDRAADGPGEVVTFSVTAEDDLDPAPAVLCVPPSGSTFPRGTTLVQCTATDAQGNQSSCEFPVSVWPRARPR